MIFRIFSFGVAATVGMALAVWTIDRDPPIIIDKAEVLTPVVTPAGMLRVKYSVHRRKECAVHIDRFLRDSAGVRYELTDLDYAKPPGPLGQDEYTMELQMPDTISQGTATFQTITAWNCNIIHKWFWPIVRGPSELVFQVKGPAPVYQIPDSDFR